MPADHAEIDDSLAAPLTIPASSFSGGRVCRSHVGGGAAGFEASGGGRAVGRLGGAGIGRRASRPAAAWRDVALGQVHVSLRRAGVHKTTLYRRWGTRDELVLQAMLARAGEHISVRDTGSLRGDLLRLARTAPRTPPAPKSRRWRAR